MLQMHTKYTVTIGGCCFYFPQIDHTLLEAKFKNKTAIKKQMNATSLDPLF